MLGSTFWAFGREFDTFRVFVYIAFVAAGAIFYLGCLRASISYSRFLAIFLTVIVAGPIGGSLLSIEEFRRPFSSILDSSSGSTHIGGYVLSVLLIIPVARLMKIPYLKLMDATTLSWVGGYGIGRLACFFSGDGCYGIQTNTFLGMRFPHGIVSCTVPVFPTPLFETGYCLAIFACFYFLYFRKPVPSIPAGRIFYGASSWMFLCRFAVEFIRTNPKYAGFSLTQWACFPLCIGYSLMNYRLGVTTVEAYSSDTLILATEEV